MTTYAIGDIQGCFQNFLQLLDIIAFDPAKDKLWLVGDLVNRGPDSLAMLRWAYTHQSSLVVTLGNHDLHTLAVAENLAPQHRSDTLKELLNAPDCAILLDWLRHQSLIHAEHGYVMVHAGLLPQWSVKKALALGAEVETVLRSLNYREFFAHMYGNQPNHWDKNLQGFDRLRLIINAMTRLRTLNSEDKMDFKFKGMLKEMPAGHYPWFDAPDRKTTDTPIICGHWSALGLQQRENLLALDTGCLWGGQLTALRLKDRKIFQVECKQLLDPLDF